MNNESSAGEVRSMGAPAASLEATIDEAGQAVTVARELFGVRQALHVFASKFPEEQAKNAKFANAVVSDDNRNWYLARDCRGDVVDLVRDFFDESSRLAAANTVTELFASLPENDWAKHSPDYAADVPDEKPPFPLALFPPVLSDFIADVAKVRGVPVELVATMVIGTMSGTTGKGLAARSIGALTVLPNLYTVVGAPSGVGKSIVGNVIFDPVFRYEQHAQAQHLERSTETKASLAAVQDELTSLAVDPPEPEAEIGQDGGRLEQLRVQESMLRMLLNPPRFAVEDATSEAMAALMAKNNDTLLSLSTDARSVFKVLGGRYRAGGGVDDDFYLKGFSGDQYRQDRITRESVVLTPCLTIAWMTQLDNLALMFDTEALTTSGFACRFLVCRIMSHNQRPSYDEVSLSATALTAYETRVRELMDIYHQRRGQPFVVSAEPAARKLIIDYDIEVKARQDSGELAEVGGFARRWAEMAWKLALMFHAAEHGGNAHDHPISDVNAHAAVEVIKWYAQEQLDILQTASDKKANKRLDAAKKFIQRFPQGVSPRDLHRAEDTLFPTTEDAREALSTLVREGAAERRGSDKRLRYHPLRAPKS